MQGESGQGPGRTQAFGGLFLRHERAATRHSTGEQSVFERRARGLSVFYLKQTQRSTCRADMRGGPPDHYGNGMISPGR